MRYKIGLFLLVLALIISLPAGLIGFAKTEDSEYEPRIWTNKSDYSPGETVTIYGEGFTPNMAIKISIQRPDNSVDTLYTKSDGEGKLMATYQLDGIEGEYTVTAKDEYGKTAITKFTDRHGGSTITIKIFGYTISPNPKWTTGVVEGYLEDQWIPFKIEVESGESGSYSLNVTVHLDYYSFSYGYGLDDIRNFRMWKNGVSETPNITDPSPDGWEDGGKIQQLQFSWIFTIEKNDNCTLYFEAHVAVGAHNYPGARIHVHIHSVTPNPYTPVSQGNKEIPVQIGSATISGYKWNDKNGDGVKDYNEPKLGDWTINLYKFEGSVWIHVKSTNTANNGGYSFKVYCAGIYMVNETIKNGWIQTFPGNNSYIVNVSKPSTYLNKNFGNKESVPPQEYPSISIDKSTDVTMAHVGDTIEYTYNVANTGNVNLTNIQVTDNVTLTTTYVGGDDGDNILEPGERWTYKSTYKVKDEDPVLLVNNATVTAVIAGGGWQISAWDTCTIIILRPAIRVEKSANVSKAYAGDVINYTITVTNVGNCALYNVNVTDTLFSDLVIGETLNVNESVTFTRIYIVKAGDPDPLDNTVVAYGYDELGMRVESNVTCSINLVAKICGYKFYDTNKNGTKDCGEDGLGGWTIQLFKWNGTVWELINSTTTDIDGFYCFDELNAGNYTVTEVLQTGWRNTTPINITINLQSGEISQGNNFGNIRQYALNVSTSPTGLRVLINGAETSTPSTLWYDECTYVNLTAPNIIQVSNGVRYRFSHWNIGGVNQTSGQSQIIIHVSQNHTVIAYYTLEYYLSVISPYGTVGGEGWYPSGATAYATLNTDIVDHGNGTRRVFTHWSGDSSGTNYTQSNPIIMDEPKTAIANWKTQYQVTFNQNGLDDTATEVVVIINGVNKTRVDLPLTDWFDNGTTYSYSSLVSSTTADKRFRLDNVTGPTSPITTSGTVTGNYIPQYKVTFAQSGLDDTASGTVVTVCDAPKTYSELLFKTDWLDHNSSITFEYSDIVTSSVSGKQFKLVSVSHTSPLTVIAPTTVVGTYKIQYQITVTASPSEAIGGTFNVTYTQCGTTHNNVQRTTPWSTWVDANTNVTISSPQDIINISLGTKLKFNHYKPSSKVNMTEPKTIILVYGVQYKLTVFSDHDSPSPSVGEHWYDDGTEITAYVTSPADQTDGMRYRCIGWIGTGSVPSFGTGTSVTFTINAPSSITWNWIPQYYLTVMDNIGGLSSVSNQSGWHDNCTYIYAENLTAPQYINVSDVERYVFIGWNVTFPVHMNSPRAVKAIYIRQYLVIFDQRGLDSTAIGTVLTVNGMNLTFNGLPYEEWFDESDILEFSYHNVSSTINGKRFILVSVNSSSPLKVTGPITVVGSYKTQHRLIVSILPNNLGIGNIKISLIGDDWAGNGNWTSYWYDNCTSVTLEAPEHIHVQGRHYNFGLWRINSEMNTNKAIRVHMNKPVNTTVEYGLAPAEIISFAVIGVGNDYGGIILVVDGTYKYTVANISAATFSWYPGEKHSYSWYSPLYINGNKRYMWTNTTINGNQLPQNGTIHVTGGATITGYYKTQYKVTFRQIGIGNEWTDAVLTVNGTTYTRSQLPISLWCDEGSKLNFTWHSSLVVSRTKAYGWYKTAGLSSKQSETITVSSSGEIVGYYRKEKPPIVPPAGNGGCKTSIRKRR